MGNAMWNETFVERKVTYALELGGKFHLVENAPARFCLETGEQFFSLETVEWLQRMAFFSVLVGVF